MTAATWSAGVLVRPAWTPGAELSERALRLLLAEWAQLGLVAEDAAATEDPAAMRAVLTEVQQRGTVTSLAPHRAQEPRMVTTANTARPAEEAPSAEFEGVLLRHGEVATIGRDAAGHLVRERFKPGAMRMPDGGPAPLLNVGHDRGRIIGHLTRVWDEGGAVRCRGVIADRTREGYDAVELARLGSVARLSVEFLPVQPTVTAEASGGRMVEHATSLLIGVGIVGAGAYDSARVTHLLDRAEAGRQREGVRSRALAELDAAVRHDRAMDARIAAHEVLSRTRLTPA